ncbi:MAG: flagellar hook capping FlgD N-terminal domain-containing protein [Geminicoccaceae bacterium]
MDLTAIDTTRGIEKAQKSGDTLAGDFETFLSLLTTQLQQQDPLSPMDAEKFTSQLVQFSSVEQAIETNRQLGDLISLMSSNMTNAAVSYLGREVEIDGGNFELGETGDARFTVDIPAAASAVSIDVLDASGNVVRKLEGTLEPGLQQLTWDGLSERNERMPAGAYRIAARGLDQDGEPITIPTRGNGIVDAIETIDGQPMLMVNGEAFAIDDVLAVRMQEAA